MRAKVAVEEKDGRDGRVTPRVVAMSRQVWVGGYDLVYLMTEIGGWWVGCVAACEKAAAVTEADRRGFLGRRMHYAPAVPEGVEAHELTDAGIHFLAEHAGISTARAAIAQRQWYRDHSAKPPTKPSEETNGSD